jgi:hypothetical protein
MRTLNHSNAKKHAEEAKETALDLSKSLDLNIRMLEKLKIKLNGSTRKVLLKRKNDES